MLYIHVIYDSLFFGLQFVKSFYIFLILVFVRLLFKYFHSSVLWLLFFEFLGTLSPFYVLSVRNFVNIHLFQSINRIAITISNTFFYILFQSNLVSFCMFLNDLVDMFFNC